MEKQFYNFVKEVYDKQLGVEGIAIADGASFYTGSGEKYLFSHKELYEHSSRSGNCRW